MTRDEVMNKWVWLPRLQMKAAIHFGKKYNEITPDQEYEIRLIILKEREERKAKEKSIQEFYKSKGYGSL